jgi:hypothetical protein
MINLLPAEEKKKIILRRNEKLAFVLGNVVLVTLICLILILLSIKFYVLAEADYYKNILNQAENKNKTADFVSLNTEIQKYNKVLNQLNSFYEKEIYFSKIIENFISVPTPEGLNVNNFSFKRKDDGVVQVSVNGNSNTRENLIIFKKSVEANNKIKKPNFPAESWINPKDINFLLTFEAGF